MRRVLVGLLLMGLLSAAAMDANAAKPAAAPKKPAVKSTVAAKKPAAKITHDIFSNDARLNKKLNYEATRYSIRNILADLGTATGVKLIAGADEKDFIVYDSRMIIFAKDMSVADLMRSIARTMKFKWVPEGPKGSSSYRLIVDENALNGPEAKKLQEDEKLDKTLAEHRFKLADNLLKMGSLSEKEIEGLRADQPFLYALAAQGVGRSISKLMTEMPDVAEALATGKVTGSMGLAMNDSARSAMVEAFMSADHFICSAKKLKEILKVETLTENINSVKFNVNDSLMDHVGTPTYKFVLADIIFMYDKEHPRVVLYDPDSSFGKYYGSALCESLAGEKSIKEVEQARQEEFNREVAQDMKMPEPGEPLVQHNEDIGFKDKIKIQIESGQLEDMLSALSKATNLNVVSDCNNYTLPKTIVDMLPQGDWAVKDLLTLYTSTIGSNWWKNGSMLEFRNRDWYKNRVRMISDDQLEAWRQMLTKDGTIGIDSLTKITNLTDDQFNNYIKTDDILGVSGLMDYTYSARSRSMLKLYSMLKGSQVGSLFSDSGLAVSTLKPEQKNLLAKTIYFIPDMPKDLSNVSLVLTRTPVNKQFLYKFAALTDKGSIDICTFITPRYQENTKKLQDGSSSM